MGNAIKWVLIVVGVWLAWRYISAQFSGSGNVTIGPGVGIGYSPYMAPLTPGSPLIGWGAPWQYASGYIGPPRNRWGRTRRRW